MTMQPNCCPQCAQPLTRVGQFWICPQHGQVSFRSSRGNEAQTSSAASQTLRIFLSYGHDANEELVRRIKADLEKRGHDVWFDKGEFKGRHDWRHSITKSPPSPLGGERAGVRGESDGHRVLSFLSKHSTRDPGVCRDEIAIAIGVKGGNIQTILVEKWLFEAVEKWRSAGLLPGTTTNKPRAGSETGAPSSESRLQAAPDRVNAELQTQPDRTSRFFWIMGAPGVGKSAFAAQLTHTRGDTVIAAQFCEWDKPDHRNAPRVVRSLAFQLATRLPDYRELPLTLPEIAELDRKDAAELFDYLLANPLRHAILWSTRPDACESVENSCRDIAFAQFCQN